MGTRSLTIVKDENSAILTMYRQFDGYPTGHGKELADFLAPFRIVNGIGLIKEGEKVANGIGCLAGQLVSHFKGDTVGGFYLYPTGTQDVGEEYVYKVKVKNQAQLFMQVYSVDSEGKRELLWSGIPKEYNGETVEKIEK